MKTLTVFLKTNKSVELRESCALCYKLGERTPNILKALLVSSANSEVPPPNTHMHIRTCTHC